MNLVVSDASPIRYLVQIEAIDVLSKLFSKVIIPEHVVAIELQDRRTPAKVKTWASHLPAWVEVRIPANPEKLNLHAGARQARAQSRLKPPGK